MMDNNYTVTQYGLISAMANRATLWLAHTEIIRTFCGSWQREDSIFCPWGKNCAPPCLHL